MTRLRMRLETGGAWDPWVFIVEWYDPTSTVARPTPVAVGEGDTIEDARWMARLAAARALDIVTTPPLL